MIYFPWIVSSVVVHLWYRTARVVWGAISKNGGTPFQTAIPDPVAYACLCLQADGGERNCEETQKLRAGAGGFQRHVVSVEKTERWVVFGGAISRNGGPFVLKSVRWFCCSSLFMCAGGSRWAEGRRSAKGMRSKWLLIAIAGEQGKDRTVSGVSRSHLQKWRDLSSAKRLLILFVLLVYVCRRMAATVDGGCQ
jgi:hypothetical protein